jgi:hypothetical protein
MRFFILILPFIFPLTLHAQATLVFSAPNDSFDLSCARCTTVVAEFALTKGQYALPLNLKKTPAPNLLMWKYYDEITKKDICIASEPFWTKGTRLIDEIGESDMLSMHINLTWQDSNAVQHGIYLVLAGFKKGNLNQLPITGSFDPDTYAPLRFNAIAQIVRSETEKETFDCLEGTLTLDAFNIKTSSISGTFEFSANRIGLEKHGYFTNGKFQK